MAGHGDVLGRFFGELGAGRGGEDARQQGSEELGVIGHGGEVGPAQARVLNLVAHDVANDL